MGDKFYILTEGTVDILLPNPEIPYFEFADRYADYQLLLKEIEARKELDRKI